MICIAIFHVVLESIASVHGSHKISQIANLVAPGNVFQTAYSNFEKKKVKCILRDLQFLQAFGKYQHKHLPKINSKSWLNINILYPLHKYWLPFHHCGQNCSSTLRSSQESYPFLFINLKKEEGLLILPLQLFLRFSQSSFSCIHIWKDSHVYVKVCCQSVTQS